MATGHHTPTVLRIPLTGLCGDRRIVRAWTVIPDDEFGRQLSGHNWHLSVVGYPARNGPRSGNDRIIYLHRVIHLHYTGPVPNGTEIDHINRDKLDNTPGNLRAVTHAINATNKRKQKNNTSGYVGVSWRKNRNRWNAYINVNGKHTYIGSSPIKEEAAALVNAAYRTHYPQVPPPNFIV